MYYVKAILVFLFPLSVCVLFDLEARTSKVELRLFRSITEPAFYLLPTTFEVENT